MRAGKLNVRLNSPMERSVTQYRPSTVLPGSPSRTAYSRSDFALDDQRVRVRELDVDVLLVDARQLALQVVRVLGLADVKARGERAHRQPRVAVRKVVVVVVQQPE